MDKTNVIRVLDQQKIPYTPHFYDNSILNSMDVAVGENLGAVFKTLITEIDEKGRVNLSYRDAIKEIKAKNEAGESVK